MYNVEMSPRIWWWMLIFLLFTSLSPVEPGSCPLNSSGTRNGT